MLINWLIEWEVVFHFYILCSLKGLLKTTNNVFAFVCSHLPVQCLCEFLLSSSARQQQKYQQLLNHLQSTLTEVSQDPEIVCEILDYFLRRLSSPRNREQAIAVFSIYLSQQFQHNVVSGFCIVCNIVLEFDCTQMLY